jgi:hypothetical protein
LGLDPCCAPPPLPASKGSEQVPAAGVVGKSAAGATSAPLPTAVASSALTPLQSLCCSARGDLVPWADAVVADPGALGRLLAPGAPAVHRLPHQVCSSGGH